MSKGKPFTDLNYVTVHLKAETAHSVPSMFNHNFPILEETDYNYKITEKSNNGDRIFLYPKQNIQRIEMSKIPDEEIKQ